MHERGQYELIVACLEEPRAHHDHVDRITVSCQEPVGHQACWADMIALDGDDAARQCAPKQRPVEMVESQLELTVNLGGRVR